MGETHMIYLREILRPTGYQERDLAYVISQSLPVLLRCSLAWSVAPCRNAASNVEASHLAHKLSGSIRVAWLTCQHVGELFIGCGARSVGHPPASKPVTKILMRALQ